MIYFDNSATTPIHPEVRDAMLPYLYEIFGNPSSKYYTQAARAKEAVEQARGQVAQLLSCDPDEVVFTSGSTESNNMILKGVADTPSRIAQHIVTTKTEHPSIIETAKYLEERGHRVTYLDVDSFARANPEQLQGILSSEPTPPALVSIIWGNNEVGSLNDVQTFSRICKENNIFFHTDATQVLGKIEVNLHKDMIQFLSCSAHKIHGPKGIGACVIKKHPSGYKTKITPLLHGGDQEGGYRSGTLSVHNIVGFGKAAEIAFRDRKINHKKLLDLEEYLVKKITNEFPDVINMNNDTKDKIPGIISVNFNGINNELILQALSEEVAMSTGSACSSGNPSHVLKEMGLQLEIIRSTLRISLSSSNNTREIDSFLSKLK